MKRKMSHKFTLLMIAPAVLSLFACSKEEPVDENSWYTEKLDEEATAPDERFAGIATATAQRYIPQYDGG